VWRVGLVAVGFLLLAVATSCASTPVEEPYQYVPETETSPYVHEVMSDEPVAYWRLASRDGEFVPGPVDHGAGNEYSWESHKYDNGAFTEAIVEALTGEVAVAGAGESSADTPRSALRSPDSGLQAVVDDGQISTDELREYVRTRVPVLTSDRQHPTVDRDNLHRKFALPLLH